MGSTCSNPDCRVLCGPTNPTSPKHRVHFPGFRSHSIHSHSIKPMSTDIDSETWSKSVALLQSDSMTDVISVPLPSTNSVDSSTDSNGDHLGHRLHSESSKRVDVLNEDDSLFEELSQFLRRLPANTRKNIWSNAAGLKRDDGRTHVLGLITDSEDITSLLCSSVVVFAKCLNRGQSVLTQQSVKWHLYRATVYINMKHGHLERVKFENDKMYFAQILQEYIRFNRKGITPEPLETCTSSQIIADSESITTQKTGNEQTERSLLLLPNSKGNTMLSVSSEEIIEDLVQSVTKEIEKDFHLSWFMSDMSEAS